MADLRRVPMRGGGADKGVLHAVTVPHLDLRLQADSRALATQLLCGERFTVLGADAASGLVWGQSGTDDYVGYVDPAGLGPSAPQNQMVTSAYAPLYPAPDMKTIPVQILPFGARLATGAAHGDFLEVGGSFVDQRNLAPRVGDVAEVAAQFEGAPYLWGGRTPAGLDCSALVQLAASALGHAAPRDSDMQWDEFGASLPQNAAPQRNDLVFWRGHVGVMWDAQTLLHANAHHMAVVKEPLGLVQSRIEAAGEGPFLGLKRIAPTR